MATRTVRGFAWMVYPDAHPAEERTEAGRPFAGQAAEGELPPGVVDFWPESASLGLEDDRTGATLLVVTSAPEPPRLNVTYKAMPAQLVEGYETEGGLARLLRLIGSR